MAYQIATARVRLLFHFYDQGEYRDPTSSKAATHGRATVRSASASPGSPPTSSQKKPINWIKQQDSNQPFLMCCHFKATHEHTTTRHAWNTFMTESPSRTGELPRLGTGNERAFFPRANARRTGTSLASCFQRPGQVVVPLSRTTFQHRRNATDHRPACIYQKLIRDYLRCGATIDDNIGKLLKTLDEMGIADNTIVVYVSDQGYFLGEHGFFDKRMFYEEAPVCPSSFVIRKKSPPGNA